MKRSLFGLAVLLVALDVALLFVLLKDWPDDE